MANDQLLFLKLAEALSKPSKAYRAAEVGLDIPKQAIEGYKYGADFGDSLRKRNLSKQTLSDALGGHPLEEGIMNLTGEGGDAQKENLSAYASILAAKNKVKDARSQQANFLLNGKLMEYDPDTGYRSARIANDEPSVPGAPTAPPGPLNISPRVPPSIPAPALEKTSGENELIRLLDDINNNYDKKFVGMADSPLTSIRQATGFGASTKASNFKRALNDLKDSVARERSGAQVGERNEWDRLASIIPDDTKSEQDFKARLPAFKAKLQSILAKRQQAYSQAGYRNPGGAIAQSSDPFSDAPHFASEQEAEASGHKGPAIVNGNRAILH